MRTRLAIALMRAMRPPRLGAEVRVAATERGPPSHHAGLGEGSIPQEARLVGDAAHRPPQPPA